MRLDQVRARSCGNDHAPRWNPLLAAEGPIGPAATDLSDAIRLTETDVNPLLILSICVDRNVVADNVPPGRKDHGYLRAEAISTPRHALGEDP